MTQQPARTPDPGDRPPRRLLDRAPGERFTAASTGPAATAAPVRRGVSRALLAGLGAGLIGVGVHLVGSQLLLFVGPLILVAATLGVAVGAVIRLAGGSGVGAPVPAVRRILAVMIAVGAVVVALFVAWAASGRYLDPFAFFDQVYGLTVPVQVVAAAVGALVGSR